jgi:hypothetical protein
MNDGRARGLPDRLERLRERFEQWRGTHMARSRLPDALWASAVKMVGAFGLHRTSRALRLDYYSLRKRVEQQATIAADLPKKATERRRATVRPAIRLAPTFVELAPVAGGCECTAELEDAAGSKMRVHLKGIGMPDLAALSRSFWNPGS